MQRKVDPREKHENDSDEFNRRTIEIANACVVGGKTTNRDRRKAMPDRVEQRHAADEIAQRACASQADIDIPQRFRGLSNAWGQFGVFHSGRAFLLDTAAYRQRQASAGWRQRVR